jgi:DNA-binding MarR family transcriptional regulator
MVADTSSNCTGKLCSSPVLYILAVTDEPDLGALASELRVVLGRLIRRLRAEHRFPLAHGALLGRLDREGVSSVSRLAEAERVRPQSMAQTVADLEAAALLSRRPDPEDRRRALVELTPRGRETLEADRRDRVGWLAGAIESELSAAERRALARAVGLLGRIAEH